MSEGGHTWKKINLVTLESKAGAHDEYRCDCGLTGKSYKLGIIRINPTTETSKILDCPLRSSGAGQMIEITFCTGQNKEFANLTTGSKHQIIAPPKGQNNNRGVWVMGVTEPVKVLDGEYTKL